MTSPQAVRDFLSIKLGTFEHESFCVLLLDSRHRLIEYVELFRGTIDGASVHPREVVKLALAKNAAALVLAHFVACNKMRLMCPWSFCARRSEGFVVERDFVGRRYITTGSNHGMPSPAELEGWLRGVPSMLTRSAGAAVIRNARIVAGKRTLARYGRLLSQTATVMRKLAC
jgi:hypothetical protein